jgi:hypothetical protein
MKKYKIDENGYIEYKGIPIGLTIDQLSDIKVITGTNEDKTLEYFYTIEIQKRRDLIINNLFKNDEEI